MLFIVMTIAHGKIKNLSFHLCFLQEVFVSRSYRINVDDNLMDDEKEDLDDNEIWSRAHIFSLPVNIVLDDYSGSEDEGRTIDIT